MKRRSKSNTENALTAALARNRSFVKPSDMRKEKRVRFEDTEMDGAPVRASSGGREATQSPRCGAPKTSEYAYFRKVKNGAVHGHSGALHKENEQLKSSKIDCLIGGTSSASEKLKTSTKDLNFSVSGEETGPSDRNLFLSARVSKYDESDQIRSKELTNKIKKRSSLLSENVTPVGQSMFLLNEASEKSDYQFSEKGVFSSKRLRLRQWVAHASFSEVEKLHPKGIDLVSLLLSRLFPKGNKNNDSSKGDANNSTKSLTFHESNNQEKGLHLSHKRDWDKELPKICSGKSSDIVLAEWDSFVSGFPSNYRKESHLQDEYMDPDQRSTSLICRSSQTQHGFPFCLPFESYRSPGSSHFKDLDEFGSITEPGREPYRLLLEWDSELGKDRLNSSIVNHDIEKNVCSRLENSWNVDQHRIVDNVLNANMCSSSIDPDQRSKSCICRSSHTQHGFPLCLPFESYRSPGSSHFKDLDEFGSIIERGREPYRLLLEWDSELAKDRINSSIANHDIEKNAFSRLANSWNVDQQRIIDNVLDNNMCPSSLFSNYYLGFNALPNYSSTDYLMRNFGPNFDDAKCAMAEQGQFSLALPCTPKCITLAEDKNGENILSNSSIFSYRDQDWFKRQVWDSSPLSKFWWKCLSAADFSAEDSPSVFHAWQFPEEPGEPFTHLYEGAFNRHLFSPMFQSSLDTFINRPLLLNHVREDIPDQELYFNDYDNGLGYRKIL